MYEDRAVALDEVTPSGSRLSDLLGAMAESQEIEVTWNPEYYDGSEVFTVEVWSAEGDDEAAGRWFDGKAVRTVTRWGKTRTEHVERENECTDFLEADVLVSIEGSRGSLTLSGHPQRMLQYLGGTVWIDNPFGFDLPPDTLGETVAASFDSVPRLQLTLAFDDAGSLVEFTLVSTLGDEIVILATSFDNFSE